MEKSLLATVLSVLLSGCAAMDNANAKVAAAMGGSRATVPPPAYAPDYYQPPPVVYDTGQVVETQIDGDFEGWTGESIWLMANGQIWQQARYAYHYHYAYRPRVLIYPSSYGWKMKVDGDSSEGVFVKRLR